MQIIIQRMDKQQTTGRCANSDTDWRIPATPKRKAPHSSKTTAKLSTSTIRTQKELELAEITLDSPPPNCHAGPMETTLMSGDRLHLAHQVLCVKVTCSFWIYIFILLSTPVVSL
uniref:Uncharacterized protein n=1 Tax=Bos mutus grunniens TaxID=30521 RepID=A0A8B9W696_BOSMU